MRFRILATLTVSTPASIVTEFLVLQADLDEVDKLFAVYEAQAAADRASTEDKLNKSKSSRQRSMKEIREEGLAAPIATDNKYGAQIAFRSMHHCFWLLPYVNVSFNVV